MTDPITQITNRLDRINTQWSLVRRAHSDATLSSGEARQALVLRYSSAIRKYIGAIVRDDAKADDIAQDAMVRLMRGDFAGADADRGRFRDLLKTSVRNMVRNHWSKENRRRPADLEVGELPLEDDSNEDENWVEAWRNNLLDLAWGELLDYQRTHKGSVAHSVLKLRTDYPDADSDELAERLADELGRPVRADAYRQQLKRARGRFAEMLIKQIADVVDATSSDAIQDELASLGLLEQVRDYLPEDAGN